MDLKDNIEPEKLTFFERLLALPWRKFAMVVILLFVGYVLSLLVSCSAIRISQTSDGDIKVSSSQSVLDSTRIEINVLNTKKP